MIPSSKRLGLYAFGMAFILVMFPVIALTMMTSEPPAKVTHRAHLFHPVASTTRPGKSSAPVVEKPSARVEIEEDRFREPPPEPRSSRTEEWEREGGSLRKTTRGRVEADRDDTFRYLHEYEERLERLKKSHGQKANPSGKNAPLAAGPREQHTTPVSFPPLLMSPAPAMTNPLATQCQSFPSSGKTVRVKAYTRKDGTQVQSHLRRPPSR